MPKIKKRTADSFYGDADKFIIFNEDPDLEPIKVMLPEPPELHLIDGFGIPSYAQKFKRVEMPQKLIELQQNCKSVDEVWDVLDTQRIRYKDEIMWIKKQWYHRLYGYWFFNCGRPVYITGWHYFYLNFFKIDVGYPKYRDRDRKFFIFADFCYRDTMSFKESRYDDKGKRIPNRYGDEMIDLGRRVCAGFVYAKHRREGATYKAECINLEIMTRTMNANSGIQSKSDDDAEEVYRTKLLAPYLNLPFFFRPMQKGKIDTIGGLYFDASIERVAGGALNIKQGLASSMTYRSSDEQAYDGFKLYFYHEDEIGKSFKIDVHKRHNIVKECLAEKNGYEMIGFGVATSTVGEMSSGGGQAFFNLCMQSNYYDRTEVGITPSYYYTLFIPADEGFLVDDYGNSKKEESYRFITSNCEKLLNDGDSEGWAEEKRKYPLKFSDCFIQSGGGIGFDAYIIETRISELRFTKDKARAGYFVRDDANNITSRVRFVDDPNGRFMVSLVLNDNESNNYAMVGNTMRPLRDLFNCGSDSFKFGQAENKGLSDGGIAVKYRRDIIKDPINKPIEEWVSDRFVLTYRFRPATLEEFCDDVLKVCQYYGAWCFPESNVPAVIDYFNRVGFGGFLKYDKDKYGNFKRIAGVHVGEEEKQKEFLLHRDYIKRRGAYEKHIDYLTEAKNIPDPTQLTKYDLLAAAGAALMGEQINYDELFGVKKIVTTSTNVLRRKNYSTRR